MDIEKIKLELALHGLEIDADKSVLTDVKFYAKIQPINYGRGNECQALPEYLTKNNGTRFKYFSYGVTKEDAIIKVYEQWNSRNSN